MNAGYATKTGTRFYYPGTYSIGHSGDLHPYPIDEEGRDVSWYDNNNFGASKSLHIIGDYNDYLGFIGIMKNMVQLITPIMMRNWG